MKLDPGIYIVYVEITLVKQLITEHLNTYIYRIYVELINYKHV